MKLQTLIVSLVLTAGFSASAQTLLFSDDFDTDDGPLSSSSLTGRLSGLAAEQTYLQQAGPYTGTPQILSNQLSMPSGSAIRFGDATDRYNWAGETTGAAILAGGGVNVSFDWTIYGTSTDWLAWRFGTSNSDSYFTYTNAGYDILLRENGENEIWAGTTDGTTAPTNLGYTGVSFTPNVGGSNQVSITYNLDSFDTGSTVFVTASVNGTVILNDSFTLLGTIDGTLFMEMVAEAGYDVDNLTITAVPEPGTAGLLITASAAAGFLLITRRGRRS